MFIGLRRFMKRHGLGGLIGKTVIGGGVIAVTLLLAAKWHIETRTKELLDGISTQARAVGSLTYGKVAAGFDGTISVANFAFQPSREMSSNMSPLIVDRATVDFGNFIDLVKAGRATPRAMTIAMEGVLVDFGTAGQMISGNPIEALACGNVQRFENVDLVDMGFRNPRTDMKLAYDIDATAERLGLQVEVSTAQAARIQMNMEIIVPGLFNLLRGRADPTSMRNARIERVTLTGDSARFNMARNRLCAEKLETSVEQAVEANVEAFVARMAEIGWMPDPAVVHQYRAYMSGEGPWRIESAPENSVDISTLTRVDDLSWLANRFALQGRVGNGAPQRFAFEKVARVIVDENGTEIVVDNTLSSAQWIDVPLSELGRYAGRDLMLGTRSGRRYVGRIIEVNATEVIMRARLPGGEATVPISRNQVRSARSYEIVPRPEQ